MRPCSAILMLLAACCCSGAAFAETTQCINIASLPAVISAQGVYCLKQDLSTVVSSGSAITINSNNVTLDCNDYKIGGLAAGAGTNATGIAATDRLNITVRNCNIRGFRIGLSLTGNASGYHLVENSRFDLNTVYGMQVAGDGSTVRRVRVYDTGNAAGVFNAYGISATGNVDLLDNSVTNVTPSSNQYAFGIYTSGNGGREISNNRISGLAVSGSGLKFGIYNQNSTSVVVRSNSITNLFVNAPGDIGIGCNGGSTGGVARDNIVVGYSTTATPISGCATFSNFTTN